MESFLEKLLPDKKRDIRIALKWARELPFNAKRTPRSYKLSDYLQKAVDYIQNKGDKVKRKELLKEVFHGQAWFLELVMKHLEKKGYVESYKEKSGGRGGPSKVYTLARPRPLECDTTLKPLSHRPRTRYLPTVHRKMLEERKKNLIFILTPLREQALRDWPLIG